MQPNILCDNQYCKYNSIEGHTAYCIYQDRVHITITGECQTFWESVAVNQSRDLRTLPPEQKQLIAQKIFIKSLIK